MGYEGYAFLVLIRGYSSVVFLLKNIRLKGKKINSPESSISKRSNVDSQLCSPRLQGNQFLLFTILFALKNTGKALSS